jgi:hypothetical protein
MLRSTSAKATVTCPWLDALFNGCLPSVLPAQRENDYPTENVGLNYEKTEWSYKKGPAGTSTGPTKPILPTSGGRHR